MHTFPCLAASVADIQTADNASSDTPGLEEVAGDIAATHILRHMLHSQTGMLENASAVRGGLADWQALQIDQYVDANIGSRIRTIDLAASLGLSISHFSRIFKKSRGMSPRTYIVRKRIAGACAMMLASDRSLTEVAHLNGFCDQSHFNRAFHLVIGVAPQAWRRGKQGVALMNERTAGIVQKKSSCDVSGSSLTTEDKFHSESIESVPTC